MKIDKIGEVLEFKKLVNYQDNSVVSKTIIDKDTGTFTLFAFDKGQSLSEHTVAFEAIIWVMEGKANVSIAGKTNVVKENESIILPSNEPHSVKAKEKFKMVLIMIK